MSAPDLDTVSIVISIASALAFVVVGYVVGRPRASREARAGTRAFRLWWYGLGGISVFTPLMSVLDLIPSATHLYGVRIFLLEALLIILVVAVGALLYYLLMVYFGKTWVIWPVATYCLVVLSWLGYVVLVADPVAYGPQCPMQSFCYAASPAGTASGAWLGVAFSIPIILGILGYFALFFQVEQRVQRRRIAMVAASLFVWFAIGLLAPFIMVNAGAAGQAEPLSQWTVWSRVISPLVSLTAALVILWAYRLRPRGASAPS
ncbi:MAG: hypothetical protein ACYDBQ_06010 [Thermoplasmatota archaeon]